MGHRLGAGAGGGVASVPGASESRSRGSARGRLGRKDVGGRELHLPGGPAARRAEARGPLRRRPPRPRGLPSASGAAAPAPQPRRLPRGRPGRSRDGPAPSHAGRSPRPRRPPRPRAELREAGRPAGRAQPRRPRLGPKSTFKTRQGCLVAAGEADAALKERSWTWLSGSRPTEKGRASIKAILDMFTFHQMSFEKGNRNISKTSKALLNF